MDPELTRTRRFGDSSERERVGRLLQGRLALKVDLIGVRCHELIGSLLVSDVDLDDLEAVLAFILRQERHGTIAHRQARRARIVTGVTRYIAGFRRPASWRFLGAEVNVGDVRLDLLWIGPDGRIEADEVKTGRAAHLRLDLIRNQAESQLLAGKVAFGDQFAGVRAVLLTRRAETFLVDEVASPNEVEEQHAGQR